MLTSLQFQPSVTPSRFGVTQAQPSRFVSPVDTVRFGQEDKSSQEKSKIDDAIYDLLRAAPKNELHVHQSGSSDLAFLKYGLLKDIREGKIKELVKVDIHTGKPTTYKFKDLSPEQLKAALDELLEWEHLREYFRFYMQIEHGKGFLSSTEISTGEQGSNMVDAKDYFDQLREIGLTAYRSTSAKINPMVKNVPAAYMLAHLYARDVVDENVRYTEYRVSPVGRNYASYQCTTGELMHAVQEGFEDTRKRLAPSRKELDYGIIALMERQVPPLFKDTQVLAQKLGVLFAQVPGGAELSNGSLRGDQLLDRAVKLLQKVPEQAGNQALAEGLQSLLKAHGSKNEILSHANASPLQVLQAVYQDAAANEHEKVKAAQHLAQEVIQLRNQYNLVGIDLAGDEANNSVEEFASAFQTIRSYNEQLPADQQDKRLGVTIHAGETSHSAELEGWQSIQKAIDLAWSPKTPLRIGHGIQVINSSPALKQAFEAYLSDPQDWEKKISVEDVKQASPLLKEIIDKGIVLEMCPKSNLQTYAVHPGLANGVDNPADKYSARAYRKHPAVFLSRLGVKVAISTDNRTISASDDTNEYVKLFKYAGLTYDDFKTMVMNGFEGAFVFDPQKKARLIQHAENRFKELERDPKFIRAMQKMGKPLSVYQRFMLFWEKMELQVVPALMKWQQKLSSRIKGWLQPLRGEVQN